MANVNRDIKEVDNPELDQLAFDIFSKRIAAQPSRQASERDVIGSYREAEMFLAVREKVRAGEVKPKAPEGPQLCDCSAPNMRKTHPHNLVSQRFGNLDRVSRIKQWFDQNQMAENDSDELVTKINHDFPDLGWDLPAVNTARAIFPDYCVKK